MRCARAWGRFLKRRKRLRTRSRRRELPLRGSGKRAKSQLNEANDRQKASQNRANQSWVVRAEGRIFSTDAETSAARRPRTTIVFMRAFWPLIISIAERAVPSDSARNSINAALARPSIGGACKATFRAA